MKFLSRWLLPAVGLALAAGCGGNDLSRTGQAGEQAGPAEEQQMLKIVHDQAAQQIDVTYRGEPFTSYVYRGDFYKPFLFPLRTADNRIITRGFPLLMTPGERVDHPHHVGHSFTYGNVNGIDFWGTSDSVDLESGRFGQIVHNSLDAVQEGADEGYIDVSMNWITLKDNRQLLEERDRIYFRAREHQRIVDRVITLVATGGAAVFGDTKEGAFAIRVTRGLEEPSAEPLRLTDAQGQITEVPVLDNTGVDGEYLASTGLTLEKQVWGTRAKWCVLRGTVAGLPVTVGMFDHPQNPAYPTYWHARAYGLFSLNPFGWKDFTGGKETLNFRIEDGGNAVFRYRILIDDRRLEPAQIEEMYNQWLSEIGG